MGMTGFETKAALEGLFSNDATFLTTPKAGAPTKAKRHSSDDLVAILGFVLALHQIVFIYVNDPYADIDWVVQRYVCMFWNICFVTGCTCVPTAFFWAKYKQKTLKYLQFKQFPSQSSIRMVMMTALAVGQIAAVAVAMKDHEETR
jgi:hypothetical protein